MDLQRHRLPLDLLRNHLQPSETVTFGIRLYPTGLKTTTAEKELELLGVLFTTSLPQRLSDHSLGVARRGPRSTLSPTVVSGSKSLSLILGRMAGR
jgi:hypothetical protein